MDVLHPIASRHLVHTQGRGNRGIEAWGHTPQRNPHQLVAVAARQQRKALILGTGHQHQRATEISIREGHVAFRGQTDHPVAAILELLERTVQVHHPSHRQMLKRAGSHLGGGTGQPRTAALGQHDAMGSHGFRGSHHSTEVVRVGDTVEGHEQRGFAEV